MVYIGNFLFLTNQQKSDEAERRYGEFSLMLETDDPETAVAEFRRHILDLRQSSLFFEGDCSVFFNQLMEFENFPKRTPMMMNYKSVAGDPIMPFIGCSVPDGQSDDCRIYDWDAMLQNSKLDDDKLFLKFDG